MRKGILGLLAYCLAGLELAQGQSVPAGGYQEPLPIQYPGASPLAVPYPAYSKYPTFQAPSYPNYNSFPSRPQQYGGYPVPAGNPALNVSREAVIGGLPPRPGGPPSGLLQTKGQDFGPDLGDNQPFAFPSPKDALDDAGPPDDGPPGEPSEPYMAGPVSTWKARKGYNFYGSAEYLFWWVKGQPLPADLSLSLSDPNTVPELSAHGLNGGRFFLGGWLNDRQDLSVEAGFFFLGSRTFNNAQTFPGAPLDNRPIFDGILSESSSLSTSTNLWGTEGNLRYQALKFTCGPGGGFLDLLAGFRFVDLSESVTINSNTTFATAPVLLSDVMITTSDYFGTHNQLCAGQIGADAGFALGRLNMNMYCKLGFADNLETINTSGNTLVNAPPPLGTFAAPGGFFSQPSNIGHFTQNTFAVVPEVGANFTFQVCDRCKLGFGYTFLYLSRVVRPGDQIDATAGGAQRPPLFFLAGQPQPVFQNFHETSFWAQGINLLVELNY